MSAAVQPNQIVTGAGSGPRETERDLNKALVRRLIDEGFSKGNLAVVDEIVAPGAKEHQYFGPNHPDGPQGTKDVINDLRRLFPDFVLTINDIVAEGDKVWVRMTGSGTHGGEFLGRPPTGKQIEVDVIDICRFVNGMMVEHWGVPDRFHLMVQLGMVPMTVSAPQGPPV
jgi:predicted ester cyclase